MSYRVEVSGGFEPQVDHIARNAQHGGQAHHPAEHMRPPGIFIIHVLHRRVFDDIETEHTLRKYISKLEYL